MAEHDQQFDSYAQWMNHSARWLTRRGPNIKPIVFDAAGNICLIGSDYAAARDGNKFPVRWIWPDQVAARLPALEGAIATLINVALPKNWLDEEDPEHGDAWLEAARLVHVTLPEST